MPGPVIVPYLTADTPHLVEARELTGPAGSLGCAVDQVPDVDLGSTRWT